MSASDSGTIARVRDLFTRAAEAGSLGAIIFRGLGAIFIAAGSALAAGIVTIADLVIKPVNALIAGITGVLGAVFGGAELIVEVGAVGTAVSIGPGGRFFVGPLAIVLGVSMLLLTAYAVNLYLRQPETGNVIPSLPDIPTPFLEDAEEDDGE